jgi:hypothetical protein
MGLLMQQFVKRGGLGLSGFLPKPQAALPRVKPLPVVVDETARQWAHAIYAGQHDLTEAEFARLEWLAHFAGCGRQLLMGHALGLIERWIHVKRRSGAMAEEVALLGQLLQAAGRFATHFPADVMEPASRALHVQLERVSHLHPRSASDALLKGTTLLEAGRLLQDGKRFTREGVALLERALPELIAADGSPLAHGLRSYVEWVSPLLATDDITFPDSIRHALDRVGPFLSMLVGADHAFVFRTASKPLTCIHTAQPLRLAPQARAGRLSGGKMVVVAMPDTPETWPYLSVSSQNGNVLSAGYFASGQKNEQVICDIAAQHNEKGQILQLRLPHAERVVFLSPSGEDLRVEDHLLSTSPGFRMSLAFNSDTKLMVSRQGMSASIMMDKRHVWQLSLRGGTIVPASVDSQLVIEATGQTVNWALRRTERKPSRQTTVEQAELLL